MSELTVVGKPVTRVDAEEKITGQAVYGYDLVLPNMLEVQSGQPVRHGVLGEIKQGKQYQEQVHFDFISVQ